MLVNDIGSRHAASERVHVSSLPSDVHVRDVVSRSLAHSTAPSPVSSMFEPVQRPATVMNYNFSEFASLLTVQINRKTTAISAQNFSCRHVAENCEQILQLF